MSDSDYIAQQLAVSQGNYELRINEQFDAVSPAQLYGRDARTSEALDFGYLGGRWGGFEVADGVFPSLAPSTTHYMAVLRSTGAASISTSITNWNNSTLYARAYLITTGASSVTSYEDHRAGPGGVAVANAVDTNWKTPVRAATAVAGTLASSFENGDTVDGVVLATGDRILIKNQAAGAENGIYVVNASGAPTRADDANTGAELVNAALYVSEGTVNADTQWVCTTNATITVGSTALVFASFSSFTGGTLTSALNEAPPVTIASSTTPAIFAAAGNTINMTGTTTVTGFDTIAAGAIRRVIFAGVLQLTHNATSMINLTNANINTAAGDVATFLSLGSGNTQMIGYQRKNGQALAGGAQSLAIPIACSDETTALTTGVAKVTFRMPQAFTLTAVRASVTTAPTGSTLIVDINEAGTTILSTKLSIDASEKTSTTAASAAVISDTALADDAEMTIDIDQVGSTIAGAGLKVYLIGTSP